MRNLILTLVILIAFIGCGNSESIIVNDSILIKNKVLDIGNVWISEISSTLYLTLEGNDNMPFVFRWLGSADCWHLTEFITENQNGIIEINTDTQLRINIPPELEANGLILDFILIDGILIFYNQIYNSNEIILGENTMKFISSDIDLNTLNICEL